MSRRETKIHVWKYIHPILMGLGAVLEESWLTRSPGLCTLPPRDCPGRPGARQAEGLQPRSRRAPLDINQSPYGPIFCWSNAGSSQV